MNSARKPEFRTQPDGNGPETRNLLGRVGRRLFPRFTDPDTTPQRLVGIVGGGGTLLVGLVNLIIYNYIDGSGVVSSLFSLYGGLIISLGILSVACGFWDHPVARWTHVVLFLFSGILGALTANRGNITSAFFIVFAIVLLVEYRFNRAFSWILAVAMLGGYLAALSVGYRDDVPYPVASAFASLITVLTFVGLFGGVTIRHRIALEQDADQLEARIQQRTAALDRALSERTVMLQEIHHRVKNNMQTISSLLAMEADRGPGAEAERALNSSRQRIQAMAGVHDVLYQSERLDRVELAAYITKLVDTLLQTASIPINADLRVEDAGYVDLSLAASLGLVLNELVSNALKHGFSTSSSGGDIAITLSQSRGLVHLVVSDNGKGLPDDFDFDRRAGVGMGVVKSVVGYRGGTIHHESNGGTRWLLEIPVTLNTDEGLA